MPEISKDDAVTTPTVILGVLSDPDVPVVSD